MQSAKNQRRLTASKPAPSPLLTAAETAQRLRLSTQTLAQWRCSGIPELPFVKICRRVFYRADDVEQFIEAGLRKSTSTITDSAFNEGHNVGGER